MSWIFKPTGSLDLPSYSGHGNHLQGHWSLWHGACEDSKEAFSWCWAGDYLHQVISGWLSTIHHHVQLAWWHCQMICALLCTDIIMTSTVPCCLWHPRHSTYHNCCRRSYLESLIICQGWSCSMLSWLTLFEISFLVVTLLSCTIFWPCYNNNISSDIFLEGLVDVSSFLHLLAIFAAWGA